MTLEKTAVTEQNEIAEIVRHSYHKLNLNCAKVTLIALGGIFDCRIEPPLLLAATAMNGAGRTRGQCGLLEGSLMFMGLYFGGHGLNDRDVVNIAGRFVEGFKKSFGSTGCHELRPGGFKKSDPLHLCEGLTVRTIAFSRDFIRAEAESRGFLAPAR